MKYILTNIIILTLLFSCSIGNFEKYKDKSIDEFVKSMNSFFKKTHCIIHQDIFYHTTPIDVGNKTYFHTNEYVNSSTKVSCVQKPWYTLMHFCMLKGGDKLLQIKPSNAMHPVLGDALINASFFGEFQCVNNNDNILWNVKIDPRQHVSDKYRNTYLTIVAVPINSK